MNDHIISGLIGIVFTLLGIIFQWAKGQLEGHSKRLEDLERVKIETGAIVPWRDAQLQQMRTDIHELKRDVRVILNKMALEPENDQ